MSQIQITSSGKTFNEVEDFFIKVEGFRKDRYVKIVEKKARNAGNFNGCYYKGHSSQSYLAYMI